MAEAGLSLGYSDFLAEIGHYLGWGRTSGNWSANQTTELASILKSGLRQFYNHPPIPNGPTNHRWSFLHPVTTISTVADDYDQTLPDNFGGIEGNITYAVNDGFQDIVIIGEQQIRSMRQGGDVSGRPICAAVRPRAGTGTTGQRFEILWWPVPNAVYVLSYRYTALQDAPSAASPYPLGGAMHSETILQSAKAEAERRFNDMRGPEYARFMEMLAASIAYDARQAPETLGYMGDKSDRKGRRPIAEDRTAYYNGQVSS